METLSIDVNFLAGLHFDWENLSRGCIPVGNSIIMSVVSVAALRKTLGDLRCRVYCNMVAGWYPAGWADDAAGVVEAVASTVIDRSALKADEEALVREFSDMALMYAWLEAPESLVAEIDKALSVLDRVSMRHMVVTRRLVKTDGIDSLGDLEQLPWPARNIIGAYVMAGL